MAEMNKISPYRDRQDALECQVQSLEMELAKKDAEIEELQELLTGKPNASIVNKTISCDNIEQIIEKATKNRARFEKNQKKIVKERRIKNTKTFTDIIKRLMALRKKLKKAVGKREMVWLYDYRHLHIFYFYNGSFCFNFDNRYDRTGSILYLFSPIPNFYWKFMPKHLAELDINPQEFEKTVMENLTKYLNGEKN